MSEDNWHIEKVSLMQSQQDKLTLKSDFKKLLTPCEVAQKLGCSIGTLANWRLQEKGLYFTKMPNGRIYYPEESVQAFLIELSENQNNTNSRMVDIAEIFITHRIFEPSM